ncbi:uncharacterized protein LOC120354581 [Nilaparvata lugens]|uniref:uncharacterized protein LOC120354581 n=1 Tax=Nilaparvata lugens TaxID=108931 RepID=UPI00193D87D6|nr:uncharacterized protein LOC120354581 [Nilaparvata lugens]
MLFYSYMMQQQQQFNLTKFNETSGESIAIVQIRDLKSDSSYPVYKKRVPEDDSSIVPLLREEEEEVETEDEDFLRLLNSRTEKPWTPLRELEEGLPYPICDVREASNQHGRRIVLKIRVPGLRTTDVYLPERFTRILSTKDIENFKLKGGAMTTTEPRLKVTNQSRAMNECAQLRVNNDFQNP